MAKSSLPSVEGAQKPTSLSSHVLDTSIGIPAKGVALTLEQLDDNAKWTSVSKAVTNTDGRVVNKDWGDITISHGVYRIVFDTASYFASMKQANYFFPEVSVVFQIREREVGGHFHVPLLISPYGYSTYRGS